MRSDLVRADVSHVIFDFDGTLSWLRHGWPTIMLDGFLKHASAPWRTDPEIRSALLADILALNGKPSIHQLTRCCERASLAGVQVPSARTLLCEYQATLRTIVDERISAIRSGSVAPGDFIVWNARRTLENLRARGLTLIILSGTVEDDVRAEAELLGLTSFFGNHIYGSPAQGAFSKKDVIERIMREERIEGHHLLAFGDGPVEINCAKEASGLAIGIASDEEMNGSHRMDSAKREQLINAGADAILPDYEEADSLLALIFQT